MTQTASQTKEPMNDLTHEEAETIRKELKEVEAYLEKEKLRDGTSEKYLTMKGRRHDLRGLLGLK